MSRQKCFWLDPLRPAPDFLGLLRISAIEAMAKLVI